MIDDFTLPNYKMKDCQTVKYDWLVCWGAGKNWLVDLLGKEQEGAGREREFARRMHKVQGTGVVNVQNAGKRVWWSYWHWEHWVKFTAVDSLLGCKHSPYFPLFTSIFSLSSYYNYKFPLSSSSLFSHEFPSHKTVTIYISPIFLSHIFTTFLHLLLLG